MGVRCATFLDCIPCFARQALEATRRITDDEAVLSRVLRRTLEAAARFDLNQTPAEMAQTIHRIIRRETGDDDPYREIKRLSTERGLALEELVRQRIGHATDPFQASVRFSIPRRQHHRFRPDFELGGQIASRSRSKKPKRNGSIGRRSADWNCA